MAISKKILFIATIGLYIPCITLTSEKPKHKVKTEYSITLFDPKRDTQSVANLLKKEEHKLGGVPNHMSPEQYILDCDGVPNCHIKVLRENNEFAGFIKYDSDAKYISSLAIENNFRNKGYGEALLKDSIKDLDNQGSHRAIRILTAPDNLPALNLYKKVGFKEKYEGTGSLHYDSTDILDSLFDQHTKAYQY